MLGRVVPAHRETQILFPNGHGRPAVRLRTLFHFAPPLKDLADSTPPGVDLASLPRGELFDDDLLKIQLNGLVPRARAAQPIHKPWRNRRIAR